MLKPIDDYYPMSIDYGAKGLKKQDTKLYSIKPGKRYKIEVPDYKAERPNETVFRLYFCFQVNSHGVYFFKSLETDRVLALTWVELLERIPEGKFKEV